MARKSLDSHGSADDVKPDFTGVIGGDTIETFVQRPTARPVGPDGWESKILGWHVVTFVNGALANVAWYPNKTEARIYAEESCR